MGVLGVLNGSTAFGVTEERRRGVAGRGCNQTGAWMGEFLRQDSSQLISDTDESVKQHITVGLTEGGIVGCRSRLTFAVGGGDGISDLTLVTSRTEMVNTLDGDTNAIEVEEGVGGVGGAGGAMMALGLCGVVCRQADEMSWSNFWLTGFDIVTDYQALRCSSTTVDTYTVLRMCIGAGSGSSHGRDSQWRRRAEI